VTELGIAMIYPNVRGSTGFGKTFLRLDNGRNREDSVKDLGALLDWIKQQPDLDGDKVMLLGGSYGGYMVLAGAVHHSDRIAGAVASVAISNFVSFLERTESYRRDLRRAEYGDERDPAMREFLESISPLRHADKISKPLFVVHGKNDPRVPINEAEQVVQALKSRNTPYWFMVASDEGHGFAKKHNADYLFYAMVEFAKRTLLQG
jgi:dipeptidyl aminopeptidase/acylaminoacyl peptidase